MTLVIHTFFIWEPHDKMWDATTAVTFYTLRRLQNRAHGLDFTLEVALSLCVLVTHRVNRSFAW